MCVHLQQHNTFSHAPPPTMKAVGTLHKRSRRQLILMCMCGVSELAVHAVWLMSARASCPAQHLHHHSQHLAVLCLDKRCDAAATCTPVLRVVPCAVLCAVARRARTPCTRLGRRWTSAPPAGACRTFAASSSSSKWSGQVCVLGVCCVCKLM